MSKGFRFSPAAWYVPENRNRALTLALVLVAAISLLDFWSPKQLGLGNLYFLVILISAGFLLPWQVVLMCLVFTVLRESFNAIPKTWPGVIPRVGNSLVGYIGTGLFVREVVAN